MFPWQQYLESTITTVKYLCQILYLKYSPRARYYSSVGMHSGAWGKAELTTDCHCGPKYEYAAADSCHVFFTPPLALGVVAPIGPT